MNYSKSIQYFIQTSIMKEQFLRCKVRSFQCRIQQFSKSGTLFNEKMEKTRNVDNEDVKRHGSYKDWWDLKGSLFGLHALNKIRIPMIRNGLENTRKIKADDIKTNSKYLKGIKILEVGCGGGILCEPLARLGADVTGIDPGLEQINIAKQHATENAHTFDSALPVYLNTTIEEHSTKFPETYDVVVASEVIEHVPDKLAFLDVCVKTVKLGGSIFFTTPNKTTVSWLGTIIIAENVLSILPKGIHDWNSFITPEELQQLLAKLGFTTILVNGIVFNILTYNWNWSKSTRLHYALHAVKSSTTSVKLSES